jgi:hypothetical protein
LIASVILSTLLCSATLAYSQGTAFTYQGQLNDGASPAHGIYDFTFSLFDAETAGSRVGAVLTNAVTTVSNGRFTVTLDFGNQFPGADRWLEIGVVTNGGGSFATLTPRQLLTATPYAVRALNAGTAGSADSVAATNISGSLAATQLPANFLTNNQSGVTLGGAFSGNGAGLTNLSATNLSSGILADARLSANVTLLNVSQTFSGAKAFTNAANSFSGNGSGLTSLNASNVSGGTLADARLSTNVALLNANQAFSGSNTFRGVALLTNVNNTLAGNGAALTSLNAANLASGSLPDARLSTNVALLNANQTFSGAVQFNSTVFSGGFTGNGAGLTNLDLGQNSGGSIQPLSLTLSSPQLLGEPTYAVSAGDVNGDSKPDLIAAGYNTSSLYVLTNNGNAGFVLITNYPLSGGTQPEALVAADINNDGKLDLISGNANSTLSVLTNNGSGGLVLSTTVSVISTARGVIAADVNGDGKLDLINAGSSGNVIQVFTNNGSGGFVSAATISNPSLMRVAAADVNGDAKVDLLGANGSFGVVVFTNNGSGGFPLSSIIATPTSANRIITADVNSDGKPDIITANPLSDILSVLTNNGSGGFALASSPGAGGNPEKVAAADFNGDGRLDLVTANIGNTDSILINTGGGNFALRATLSVGNSPQSVAPADFNGDGRLDLVTACVSPGTLFVHLNNGVEFEGVFVGNGGSLSNLNAAQLVSGTIADGRLSTNVALLNGNNPFSGTNGLNDRDLRLRGVGDVNHAVGWYGSGKTFAGFSPDGPMLFGYSAGGLGTTINTQKVALMWNSSGNVGIGINNPTNKLHVLGGVTFSSGVAATNQNVVWTPGSASWSFTSDRDTKDRVARVDAQSVLEKVARIPINEWSYIGYGQRHIGPMAQDFHAQFPLNENDKALNDADLHGVALAAIQGLNQKVEEQREQLIQKQSEIGDLKEHLARLNELVNTLAEKNAAAR